MGGIKMTENEKNTKKESKPEIFIVPRDKALDPNFFNAMINFQYGDPEESDQGFEKMKNLAQQKEKQK